MPSFRYTAGFPRIYTDRSLQVNPGDVVEWDEVPGDGQWEPVNESDRTGSGGDNFPDEQAKADDPSQNGTGGEQATTPSGEDTKKTTKRAAPAPKTEE